MPAARPRPSLLHLLSMTCSGRMTSLQRVVMSHYIIELMVNTAQLSSNVEESANTVDLEFRLQSYCVDGHHPLRLL